MSITDFIEIIKMNYSQAAIPADQDKEYGQWKTFAGGQGGLYEGLDRRKLHVVGV